MKKLLKICLIVAGCLIFVGAVFSGISYAIGGADLWNEVAKETNGHVDLRGGVHDWNVGLGSDGYTTDAEITKEDYQAAKASEVSKLEVNFGAGVFTITESDDDYFHVLSDTDYEYEYGVKNGTFYLNSKIKKFTNGNNKNYVEIAVPKSAELKSVKLDLGACECYVDSIATREKIKIDMGAGSIVVKELNTKDADIEIGMGSVEVAGNITGDLTIDCNMGSVEMSLLGSESDHNYDVSCSMGSMEVGNISIEGMSAKKKINNNAKSDFDINCNMGSIEIYFIENI